MTEPVVHSITVYVETDEVSAVDAIADRIGELLCPHDSPHPHECPIPWFVVSEPLASEEAESWRDLLNRGDEPGEDA